MRSLKVPLMVSLVLAMATLATAQEWSGAAAVGFQVSDRKGRPIAAARVTLELQGRAVKSGPPPVETDTKGRAVVANLAPGTWQVEISHPEYLSYVAVLDLVAGKKPNVTASFLQAGGSSLTPMKVKITRGDPSQASPPLIMASTAPPPTEPAPVEPAAAPAPQEAQAVEPTEEASYEPAPPEPEPAPEVAEVRAEPAPLPAPEERAPAEREAIAPTVEESPPVEREREPVVPTPAAVEPKTGPPPAVVMPPAKAAPEPEPKRAPTTTPAPPESVRAPSAATPPPPAVSPTPASEEAAAEPETPPAAAEPSATQPAISPPPEPAPAAAEEIPSPTPPTTPEEVAPAPTEVPTPPSAPTPPAEPMAPEPVPALEEPAIEVSPRELEVAPEPEPEEPAERVEVERAETPPPAFPPVVTVPSEAPKTILPAPPATGPVLSSFRDDSCIDCKTGEWSVASSAAVKAANLSSDRACPAGLGAAAQQAAERLSGSRELEGLSFAGAAFESSAAALAAIDPETASAIEALLAPFAGSHCGAVAVVLPKFGRFVGFEYGAIDAQGGGLCLPEQECEIGDGRWLGSPEIVQGSGATVVYGIFRNLSVGRERRAELRVFFRPPTAFWRPPAEP